MGSFRDSFSYPVSQLRKEIGWSSSKVDYLIASGQLDAVKDVHGDWYVRPGTAYYYMGLPNSYRLEQFADTRDYGPLLKARGL